MKDLDELKSDSMDLIHHEIDNVKKADIVVQIMNERKRSGSGDILISTRNLLHIITVLDTLYPDNHICLIELMNALSIGNNKQFILEYNSHDLQPLDDS